MTEAPDTATPDKGTPDKGTPDKGTPDKGTPDKGTPDKGATDVAREPGSLRLICALGLAGLISGIVLVAANRVTAPAIERNRARALERAIFEVLPGATAFEALELHAGKLRPVPEAGSDGSERVYLGRDAGGALIGCAISGEIAGFQDTIKGIFGFDAERDVIIGFEVLESRETPGLGDKIYKDASFRANFTELAVDPRIETVPSGKKRQKNEVETITGATISSKAVVRLLEASLARWRPHLEAYLGGGAP